MVATLIVFVYLLFLLFSIGFLGRIFVGRIKFITTSHDGHEAIDHLLLFGLVILTTALSIISIFSKIGLLVHLVIFVFAFSGVVYYRALFYKQIAAYADHLKNNRSLIVYFALLWPLILIGLLYASGPITNYDTGLYHAQYIQWISRYHAVPGLAWIHERFGFNSHFHIACAFFDFSFLDITDSSGASIIFYPLNSFLFFMFMFRCTFGIHKWLKAGNSFFVIIYSLLLALTFLSFGPGIQSPTPDIATALLTFYVFLIFLEDIATQNNGGAWTFYHLLFIATILVLTTFKLTAALVILLVPFLLFFNRPSLKILALFVVMGCVVIIPYLVRNTIITGWIIFPFANLDLFNFDWQLPAENVQRMTEAIKGWARTRELAAHDVAAMSMKEWLPFWWKGLSASSNLERLTLWILYFNLASPLFFLPVIIIHRNEPMLKVYTGVFFVLVANLLFWFVNAPEIRFAFGFLFFNCAFLLAALFANATKFIRPAVLTGIFMTFVWAFEIQRSFVSYITISRQRELIYMYPGQIDIPPTVEVSNDDKTLVILKPASGDQCFNVPVPCSPAPRTTLKLRGTSIEDGFKYPDQLP